MTDSKISGNGRYHPPDEDKPDDPEKDFPITDEYEDFEGKKRKFEIDYNEMSLGFLVVAKEIKKKGAEGYEFSAFDGTSPYLALGQIRGKIRQALATRYLKKDGSPTHDTLRGRITYDLKRETVGFVIDGKLVSLDRLGEMAQSHEGWNFTLKFIDPCEDE